MDFQAYFLTFRTPVHFGRQGIGQERIEQTVHSDTLWGALVQTWSLLFADSPEQLCRETPFRVSSCFPVIRGRPFFPMPLDALDSLIQDSGQAPNSADTLPPFKELKRITHLSDRPLTYFFVLRGNRLILHY